MKALTELYPENEEIWAGYAEICEETNNLVVGVEAANKASKLAPNNPGYQLLLARLSRKSGQLDRALAELSNLEQKNPTNANVLTELGMLYEDRRQYTEALDAFQRSIACNGNSSIPYLRAGVVLKHLKIYPQAGEMLGKAVELNPQDHEALHQLAAVRALELVHGGIREMAVTT
jgi:tetratricopeptide (TPR) repeat protein